MAFDAESPATAPAAWLAPSMAQLQALTPTKAHALYDLAKATGVPIVWEIAAHALAGAVARLLSRREPVGPISPPAYAWDFTDLPALPVVDLAEPEAPISPSAPISAAEPSNVVSLSDYRAAVPGPISPEPEPAPELEASPMPADERAAIQPDRFGEVVVDAGDLAAALACLCAVVDKRYTIPILANVLLQDDGDRLELVTTDLDEQVRVGIPARILAPIRTTVQAHTLRGLAAKAKGEVRLVLAEDEPRLSVITTAGVSHMPRIAASDFPVMMGAEGGITLSLPAASLREAATAVLGAMPGDRSPIPLGAGLEVDDEGVRLVATDGYRLVRRTVASGAHEPCEAVIPKRVLAWVAKFGSKTGEVFLDIGEDRARLRAGDTEVAFKLNLGSFPNYGHLLAKEALGVSLDPIALRQAVELVASCSGQSAADRVVCLDLGADGLRVLLYDATTGAVGETWVDADPEGEAALRVGVKVSLLVAALKGFAKGDRAHLTADGRSLFLRSTSRPEQESVVAQYRVKESDFAFDDTRLDRPEVTFTPPWTSRDDGSVSPSCSYAVTMRRWARQRPDHRTLEFATPAGALRAYRRHVAALRRTCAVDAPEPHGPVSWLSFDQMEDLSRRASRIYSAHGVFAQIADGDVPWTRKVLALKDVQRLAATPAATLTHWNATAALKAIAKRALGRAAA